MKIFAIFLVLCCFVYSEEKPQKQIIIIENFLTPEMSQALISFYERAKKNLKIETDNELSISSISNRNIRRLILKISDRILRVMQERYPLMKSYHLDHAGLYARIEGNSCSYHADNIYFECPIHGKNQGKLRTTCDGNCPGAKFVSNHTSWREYTALVYLNDDFTGGEIQFEDGPFNRIYKQKIPIQANMMILAPNGANFYHEVFPIKSGKRHSLHLWFTSNPNRRF